MADYSAMSDRELDAAVANIPPKGCVITDDGKIRRVLGALPMTADGCVVGVGQVSLWCPSFMSSIGKTETYQSRSGTCRFYYASTSVPGLNTWADVPVEQCYSTKESAALAAVEAKREP